jgi:hypothetical protein
MAPLGVIVENVRSSQEVLAMEMNQTSPTSSESPCWLVGRNSRGHWTARDCSNQQGGLFASLAAAKRYVRLQTIGRDAAIVMVTGHLELDLSAPSPHARELRK